MEKVRGKAQSAIDLANTMFQASRAELTTQVDVLVHLMHNRFYYQVRPLHQAYRGRMAVAGVAKSAGMTPTGPPGRPVRCGKAKAAGPGGSIRTPLLG